MRRLLGILKVEEIHSTGTIKQANKLAQKMNPAITFLDLDLEAHIVEEFSAYVPSHIKTHLVLLNRKHSRSPDLSSTKDVTVLGRPVTLNRLNDIEYPYLSFRALLEEAEQLISQNSAI